jgi:hypothetical protein
VGPAAVYRRHEPERTALYTIVEAQLETALEQARLRSEHGFGYPAFVERTFRDYLACGRRELGFTRVRCASCGFERLLAFSCKRRGLCPSCESRRMADTAAHLVDRVLPVVPYRQWVLSLPIPVRLLLAREPALLSKTLRIFTQRLFAYQRRRAREMGIEADAARHEPRRRTPMITDARCAAVTFVQRGGGAINVNPHFHTVGADGVFDVRDDGSVRFVPLLAPTDEDVEAICAEVASRVLRMVERHRDDAGDDDLGDDDGLSPTLPLAFAPGPSTPPAPRWEHPAQQRAPRGRRCATVKGFSLHAETTVGALDRRGLERLCRYGLRSSFALSRLTVKEDGTLRYRLKRPWPDGRTELRLEPLELMRRLALLIPPPRAHTVRYHGAFAPASSIRAAIRPRALSAEVHGRHGTRADNAAPGCSTFGHPDSSERPGPPSLPASTDDRVQPQESKPKEATTPNLAELDPDLLLTVMGDRPDEASLLPVRQRRLDWATLLRRVFAVDLTVCPRCTGAMKVLCAVNDPPVVQKILRHLGLPTEGPRCAPARGPPEPEFDFDIDQDTEPWGDDEGLELDVEDENLEA